MCGIVGVASNGPMTVQMKDFFQSLLYHDVVRGAHATGVAAIDTHDRSLAVVKKAVPSDVFLRDEKNIEELFAPKHNFNLYIGHNRYATMGDKSKDENAHPFVHGNIVGVHNGSLRDQTLLDDHKDFVVDSDNLYHHLNRNGLDDTIKKTNGAYSLVWYDRSDNSLNFIRNDERPMAIGRLTNGCLVWASEIGMLRWLVSRHRSLTFESVKHEGVDVQNISQLEKGTHLRFEVQDKTRVFGKPIITKKSLPVFQDETYSRYWAGGSNNTNTTYQRPSRSPHQIRMDNVIKKFIPTGDSSSHLELKFIGKINPTNKFGGTADMSLFRYVDMNGVDHLFHAYNHSTNPCTHFTDADVGTTVYAQIGAVCEKSQSTYEGTICPNSDNNSMSLFALSLERKSATPYFSYWTEDMLEARRAKLETTEKKNEAGTESRQESKEKIVSIEQARVNQATNGNVGTITFANMAAYPANKARQVMAENNFHCANCGDRLSNARLNRLYLLEHYDCEQAMQHNYLTCSFKCHNEMAAYTREIDNEFLKLVGQIGE